MINGRKSILERINGACEQFEEELKQDKSVDISEWIKLVPEENRGELFFELLSLETHYQAEVANITDYFDRYPQYSNEIVRVFSENLSRKQEDSLSSLSCIPGIDPLAPGDQFERFQIISVLGAGGFSIVYLAHDPLLDKAVALKVLNCKEETGPKKAIECLINEANVLGRIDHPSIPKVHDVGEDRFGNPWVAREFIKGQSLYQLLATDQLSVVEVLRVLVKTARALDEVHQSGFAHRDIKPDNIVIELDGEPRILDYGLAIHEDVQKQHRGERAGTTHFMSPEQVRGQNENLDGRTDIWSLGVILYLVIANRLPFQGTEKEDVRRSILNQPVKPPRQIKDNSATVELENICFRALKKDPEQRYSTANDFADALHEAIEILPSEFLLQEESRSRKLSKKEEYSIQLARQSRFWNDQPHPDNLPGLLRYLRFRFRTKSKLWTDSERKMMRASSFRFLRLGSALTVFAIISFFVVQHVQRFNEDLRVLEVMAEVRRCPIDEVQSRFDELSSFAPRKCIESVERAFAATNPEEDEAVRIRYAMLLAPSHPEYRSVFVDGLLNADFDEIETLRTLAFGSRPSPTYQQESIDPKLRQTLKQIIATSPFVNGLETVWPGPPIGFNEDFKQYGGEITGRYAWCASMRLDTFQLISENFRRFRYQPVCVRPWRSTKDEVTRVAAVWHRSADDWKIEFDMTPEEFMARHASEKMHLVDISDGLQAPGEEPKLVAIWSSRFDPRGEAKQMLLADRIPELKDANWDADNARSGIISCDVDTGYLDSTPFLVDVKVHDNALKYNVSMDREHQKIKIGDMLVGSCSSEEEIVPGSNEAARFFAGKSMSGQAWFAVGEYEQSSRNFTNFFEGNWKELLPRTLAFAKAGDPINARYAKAVLMKKMRYSLTKGKRPYVTLKASKAIASSLQAEIDYWDDHDIDAFVRWAQQRIMSVELKRNKAKYSIADEYYSIAASCISVNKALLAMTTDEAKENSNTLKEMVEQLLDKSEHIGAKNAKKCIRWHEPDDSLAAPFYRPYLRKHRLQVRSSAWTVHAKYFQSQFLEPGSDRTHRAVCSQLGQDYFPVSIVLGKKINGRPKKGSIWHCEVDHEELTQRRQKVANAACLALRYNEDVGVWNILSAEQEFPLKRQIIDSIYRFGVSIYVLLDRLDMSGVVAERISLLETIRHYSRSSLGEVAANKVLYSLGLVESSPSCTVAEKELCKVIRSNLASSASPNITTVGMAQVAIPIVNTQE